MSGATTFHVTLSIRGTLAQSRKEQAVLARSCTDEKGQPYTLPRFQNALMELLSQGVERIPFGAACNNFDPKRGCGGHPTEVAVPPASELTPSAAKQARARQESCRTCQAGPGDYCLDRRGVRRAAHEPRLRAAGLPTGRAA